MVVPTSSILVVVYFFFECFSVATSLTYNGVAYKFDSRKGNNV